MDEQVRDRAEAEDLRHLVAPAPPSSVMHASAPPRLRRGEERFGLGR